MDIDADLLALAGDDSSDEGNTPAPKPNLKAPSPLPPVLGSSSHARDSSAALSNSTPNARAAAPKRTKKIRKEDSEEEGETSSISRSPNSLQSAPMSESDSDSAPTGDGGPDGPVFAIDNKFYSEKDKNEIMSLTEVQREEILADRAVQLERKLQDQNLRRMLVNRQREDAKAKDKKRKATDLEESPRKSSRQKTTLGGRKVGETSGAIEAYKRQREEKGLRDQQRRREGASRKDARARSSSAGRGSSADAEGESEVEWDDGKLKVDDYRLRHAELADYHDVRRATLPRFAFADYCFHPGFPEAIRDCYVRLASKPKANGDMAYELALVKGLVEKEGWDYAVEKSNQKKVVTNQHIQISIEGSIKEFHFNGISNTAITEAEVANYKNLMSDGGKPLPTKPFLQSKLDDIKAVINHRFTDEELQEKLRRSGALQDRAAPIERTNVINRRRAAEERGDEAAIAKCDTELASLNGPKLRYGTFLVDPKINAQAPTTSALTQQERLHELNLKNRKQNREDVRKAQLAERKAQRLAREAVLRGEAVENPFARVKTYAKTHHDVNESLTPRANRNGGSRDISRSVTPAAGSTPKKEEPRPEMLTASKPQAASGMPVLRNRNMDDDIIASMDLGIDIEI